MLTAAFPTIPVILPQPLTRQQNFNSLPKRTDTQNARVEKHSFLCSTCSGAHPSNPQGNMPLCAAIYRVLEVSFQKL
jgi:hypothetical protein